MEMDPGIAWVVIFAIQSLLILLGNILTILTFTINRRLRKRSIYFLLNLAVADCMAGAVAKPIFLAVCDLWFPSWKPSLNTLAAYDFFNTLTWSASMFSLTCVALERMCAAVWPVRHRNASSRMYITAIALTWITSVMLASMIAVDYIVFEKKLRITFVIAAGMCLLLVVIVMSYTALFIKVKLRYQHQQPVARQRAVQRELDLAKTLFIVTVLSILTWMPFAVFRILKSRGFAVSRSLHLFSYLMLNFNCLINPVIYAFRMQKFKLALHELVCKCSHYRSRALTDTTDLSTPATPANLPTSKPLHFVRPATASEVQGMGITTEKV